MKIFLFLFLLPLLSYSQKNTNAINILIPPSTTIAKPDSIILDSVVREKVTLAFAMVQKYTKKSLVYPKDIADFLINCYTGISVGTIHLSTDGYARLITHNVLPNNLVVFVDSTKRDSTDHIGKVYRFADSSKAVIALLEYFIKENSVEIVASVLLHELTHFGLMESNLYQSADQDSMNEYIAYKTQVNFLYYVYAGPEIEKQQAYDSSPGIIIEIPPSDIKNFTFFENQSKKYNPYR